MNFKPFCDFLKFIVSIILILSFVFLFIILLLSRLPENIFPKGLSIFDTIEIAGIASLAIGTLIYMGLAKALNNNYSFLKAGFGSEKLIMIYGALFVSFFALSLYLINTTPSNDIKNLIQVLILLFVFGFIAIGYALGKYIIIPGLEKEKVMLMRFVRDASGNTISEPIPNLILYQTTDVDYRFKDDTGKEYIIPIEQVQEIKKP